MNKDIEKPVRKKLKEEETVLILNRHRVSLTNLHKLYWPDEKITKGDLINYYQEISTFILPYLKDKPLSLRRNPNGILDNGFFHKDAGDSAPSWMKKELVYSESTGKNINYLVCNDEASLIYIVNMGCIEINPWNSTIKKPNHPDYLIIDIDPSDKNNFEEVIETAQVVKNILDKAGITAYCKTSGASGLHVYIPMGAKYEYDVVREFGHFVASQVVNQLPAITSIERSLSKRGNKIYVDYLQNSKGQTLAAAYSARPRPGATVSAPLDWKEVKKGLHPSQFTIRNMAKRLNKKGDLFKGVLSQGMDIKKALRVLQS